MSLEVCWFHGEPVLKNDEYSEWECFTVTEMVSLELEYALLEDVKLYKK